MTKEKYNRKMSLIRLIFAMKAIAQIGLLMAGRISFQHLFKTCVLRTLRTVELRAKTMGSGEKLDFIYLVKNIGLNKQKA